MRPNRIATLEVASTYGLVLGEASMTGSQRRSEPVRVAIVGANFAGLSAAAALGAECAVTVVEPKEAFEWLPNIHELLSGTKQAATLRVPLAERIRALGHRLVRDRAVAVAAEAGRVILETGPAIHFDYCIVAVGGVDDTFDVPGVERHAMPFKSVDDCARIRDRLLTLASRPTPFSVVIVGGGLEGIEALGELLRGFRKHPGMKIDLIEADERLFPQGPPSIDESIRNHVRRLPVHVHTGERVARVSGDSVSLASGRELASDLTIWTGGVRPPELLVRSGLSDSPRAWAPVRPTLFSTRFDHVLVAGDAAELPTPLPKQAYHAIDMGRVAAANVLRHARGEEPREFTPAPKPVLLAFGDLDTFLIIGSWVVASPLLAVVKEAVLQTTMATLDPVRGGAALDRLAERARRALVRLLPPHLPSVTDLLRLVSIDVHPPK